MQKKESAYKHLYLIDCQFLVGTVQNLLFVLDDVFISYFKIISNGGGHKHRNLSDNNGTIMLQSDLSIRAAATIETYFTKAYSILDIVCKICYELQFELKDFTVYHKMNSANILWGSRKRLNINGYKNTIF